MPEASVPRHVQPPGDHHGPTDAEQQRLMRTMSNDPYVDPYTITAGAVFDVGAYSTRAGIADVDRLYDQAVQDARQYLTRMWTDGRSA